MENIKSRNQRIRKDICQLVRKFGDIELRLSGEGKLSFLGTVGSGWVGFAHLIFDGDMGCMTPLDGYETSALDIAFVYLKKLSPVPHLNIALKDEYLITHDTWLRSMDRFKAHIRDNPKLEVYRHEVKVDTADGEEVIATIQITPVCNPFVSGEYSQSENATIYGTITSTGKLCATLGGNGESDEWEVVCSIDLYDHPEAELVALNQKNTIVYRSIVPCPGDYVMKDTATGDYVILPKDDYPGAFH